jgi:septation ring formation regulator EzrA
LKIQKSISGLDERMSCMEKRMASMEEHWGCVLHHLGDLVGAEAHQNKELDRLRERIERIERRLEIAS